MLMARGRGMIGVGLRGFAAGLGFVLIASSALAQSQAVVAGSQLVAISGFKQALAEAVSEDAGLAAFYAENGYQPIWTTGADAARRAALFSALSTARLHGLPEARYDAAGLKAQLATVKTERARGKMEAALSLAYIRYARDISSGILEPKQVDAGIVREILRPETKALMQAIASSVPEAALKALPPQVPQYAQLLRAKLDLEQVIARGGWGEALAAGKLSPGDTGARVIALRDRLQAMGYLGRSAAAQYDAEIERAVQLYQIDMGLPSDGVLGESTLNALNTAPEERLKSVLVALERLRWMRGQPMDDRYIWVNQPDFTVRIYDNHKMSFESVTVIGQNQGDRRSPEFSDEMEVMVVNPSWNVPRSITVKEYLPMMKRNAGAAGHIKIVDRNGREVPRGKVNFGAYSEKSFPYSMRQAPSEGNALGLVKFLFPNPYNIYLHDTPSKSLFSKEVRAFSHGCIRVGKPFDLAYALLAKQSEDPQGAFQKLLDTGRETPIKLEKPVPVHLVYFTAWPTAKGRIEHRRDVYGRDAALWAALEEAGVRAVN